MCGIAGIVNFNQSQSFQADKLLEMTNRMASRGPDDEGFLLVDNKGLFKTYYGDATPIANDASYFSVPEYPRKHISGALGEISQVAMGHRRLSIVDLTAHGHQPMCTIDRRYWIVYNGEIYNFKEIALDLERENIKLHGHSDTEVLLNSYAAWGEGCLQKLNGMFAFAIWDNENKTLFCARDRIGIKPFYYTIQKDKLIFASDIKTIIASNLYKPMPDIRGLYLAMAFGIAPRPLTAFKDVLALDQAHWMKVYMDGKIEKHRYWSIPVCSQDHNMTENEAIQLLEEQLTESVRRRLVADVPVGTFMSGGIDSTTISAIASKLHPGIKAFTLAYESTAPEMDEIPQAIATSRLHSMDHIVHCVNPLDSLKDLDAWIEGYEEPFYSIAANYVISKLVKDNNVIVVLNGLGGDELFAGYHWYSHIGKWRLAHALNPWIGFVSKISGKRGTKLKDFCQAKSADRMHSVLFAQTSDHELRSLFKDPAVKDICTPDLLHEMYADGIHFTDEIEAISYMDIMNYIGNHHVHRIDQFTMAHSIEGRFPFLDHKVIESAFRIPSKYKIKGKIQKYVLRKVAEKYIAPQCLSMGKKGFGLPLKQWIEGPLKLIVEEKINNLEKREVINAGIPTKWLREYKEGKGRPNLIWHLVALEMWFCCFID